MRSSPEIAFTAFAQIESPRPSPVRSWPAWANGRNRAVGAPSGRPPHSSSTSMRTRVAVVMPVPDGPQRDAALGAGELERVLQQIGHRRGEDLTIGFHDDVAIDRGDGELEAP